MVEKFRMKIRHDAGIARRAPLQGIQKRLRVGVKEQKIAPAQLAEPFLEHRRIAAGVLDEQKSLCRQTPVEDARRQKPFIRLRTFIDAERHLPRLVQKAGGVVDPRIVAVMMQVEPIAHEHKRIHTGRSDLAHLFCLLRQRFGAMPRRDDAHSAVCRLDDGRGELHPLSKAQKRHLTRLAHGENAGAAFFHIPFRQTPHCGIVDLAVLCIRRDHGGIYPFSDLFHRLTSTVSIHRSRRVFHIRKRQKTISFGHSARGGMPRAAIPHAA